MIFLPIKPKYAFAIHNGIKRVEFRKTNLSNTTEKYCLVYACSPIKKIIGYFEIDEIEIGSPDVIWSKYNEIGCISENEFKSYYIDNNKAVVLKIKRYIPLKKEIDPMEKLRDFTIPQSFCYLQDDQIRNLSKKLYESYHS